MRRSSSKIAALSHINSSQSCHHVLRGLSVFYRTLWFYFSKKNRWRYFGHYFHIQSNLDWNSRMVSVTESNEPSFFESFSIDIRLDWETYNIVPQDNQLLDMLLFIGQPLPVIKDGQEVVPAVQEEDCYRCEEKPFIQVKLREHEGACANRPFDITPSQQVWQAVLYLSHSIYHIIWFHSLLSLNC